MNKINFFTVIIAILFANVLSAQSNISAENIGIIFKIDGPFKIHRSMIYNIISSKNEDYDSAIKYMKNESINPTLKLKQNYILKLKVKYPNLIVIDDSLSVKNFPLNSIENSKTYKLNLTTLKSKFNIEKILIVDGFYGLEFESIGFISGDKRTNISLINYFVNLSDNKIEKKFYVGNIKNITKKDLLNPPNYPNIVESMNRLLYERVLPEIDVKLDNL